MHNYSSPGGRTYLSFRSANPNPEQRYVFSVSNGFALGTRGIRDLGKWLIAEASKIEKAEKEAIKAAKAVVDAPEEDEDADDAAS